MRSIDLRAVCVSVHDVAPSTWPLCQRLLNAIRAVADIPTTLLVVPAYHQRADGGHVSDDAEFDRLLERQLARGHELALHGYTHLDNGPQPVDWRSRFARRVYTSSEGEFSAIGAEDAAVRLQRGLEWFARRRWPVHGFVAPAWLLSPGGWRALEQFSFEYTTTFTRFFRLPQRQTLLAPSLVYSARNEWGSACSRLANTVASKAMQDLPLVRLGLHPRDAGSPQTVAHFQHLLEDLLATRKPYTKAAFAGVWDWRSTHAGRAGWIDA
jgi:predicted deacetylase